MTYTNIEYATMNLETLAENISAYASYASNDLNSDAQYEYYDRVQKAQKAVKALARWMKKNERFDLEKTA